LPRGSAWETLDEQAPPLPVALFDRRADGSFIVRDAAGQALAYVYFEDAFQRQSSMKRLSRDEAFLVAVNIAKLPVVGQFE